MKRDQDRQPPGSAADAESTAGDRQQIVDLDFLRGLIAAVDESGIDSLEISRAGTRIRVAKSAPAAAQHVSHQQASAHLAHGPAHPASPPGPAFTPEQAGVATPPAVSNLIDVKSPMVGTFYRAASPDAPNYAELGSRVVKGQTLCILEAMKLMNELESEVEGVVREICVGNAEPVEYGQVLFRVEPAA